MVEQSTALEHGLDLSSFANSSWKLDPSHSTVQFTVRHMVSRVNGTFSGMEGTLTQGAADLTGSALEVAIDPNTINTHSADRDNHLRTHDFFHIEKHPKIIFKSTSFVRTGSDTFDVHGDLTILGVTKPVILHAIDHGRAKDAWGGSRAGFEATTIINRHEFGLNWNMALEAGGMMLGEKVTITLDTQFVWSGSKN